jgi:hypothetical protein
MGVIQPLRQLGGIDAADIRKIVADLPVDERPLHALCMRDRDWGD